MAVVLVGVGGTIAGVVLGWYLSRFTAREVAREERQWQEAQMVRERQESAASQLRAAVIEAQDGSFRWPWSSEARQRSRSPTVSAPFVTPGPMRAFSGRGDDDIDERFHALDMALFMAIQDTTIQNREAINFWLLSIALVGLRKALDAYLRRGEPQPPPEFPTSKEQVEIAGSADVAIDQIRRHFNKQRRGG